jgi:glycosyltransferase involved in cell wall biosynthesis
MKVVIVMTYFDRPFQLKRTLNSFLKTKHTDFEVIIVDDCSEIPPEIANYDLSIELYKTKDKRWIDGSPAYNLGISYALEKNPDVIILQNAECYHVGDVISYATKITDPNYISFGCYNLSKSWTFKEYDLSWIIANNNFHAVNNEDNAWLNHKTIRQMGYHWCSAISADNMRKLNGFDERFCNGYCFEDDEFLARVKMLGLNVEITDSPFVVHQWHDRNYVPKNWHELFEINRKLLDQVVRDKNPQAIRKFTENFNV